MTSRGRTSRCKATQVPAAPREKRRKLTKLEKRKCFDEKEMREGVLHLENGDPGKGILMRADRVWNIITEGLKTSENSTKRGGPEKGP